jgi:hypothetical protein
MAAACANPIESLPHTVFPSDYQQQYQQQYTPYQQPRQEQHVNYPPPPPPRSCFSPQLTRDQYQSNNDNENAALQNQVSSWLFQRKTKFHLRNILQHKHFVLNY